jgi:hypothetical protein
MGQWFCKSTIDPFTFLSDKVKFGSRYRSERHRQLLVISADRIGTPALRPAFSSGWKLGLLNHDLPSSDQKELF